ncbi:SusC/RagA family TonB-linked outer membrane protein [Sphingobacterium bambusae]|uniref:SusC/RagA family TonB-linked outer membrane protein n=1 Tax=Sphingobacterium bambusae TaxID=662858 RepID=A0ABW6BJB0_9SPHI|nr:SusC/RagA family TonB-linked outer membrane protein [Sphingobacterium bambusae]WPL49872.1 SusC/RagA family TonB-linked outer membrane protein [Sphingobacterium bambusae]
MREQPLARCARLFGTVVALTIMLIGQVFAQQRTLTGVVKDGSSLQPIVGASVRASQTASTSTNDQGAFTLQVAPGTSNLQISFVGYESQQVPLGDRDTLSIFLVAEDTKLDEVVVTALGINREQKSLTYSTQQLKGEELTRAKGTNLINNINGKVAGVNISSSSSGIGGSAKVVLRGNKSASGSNQVLYVIDGVPINNNSSGAQPGSIFGGERDPGDPIALINPDDIESMSVLKGASAAALYGSQAANGVILITTKSGKDGRTSIDFSSSAQIETPAVLPKFQNNYGRGMDGENSASVNSWGAQMANPGSDQVNSFFQTGTNFTNSISLSRGNEHQQTYLSYANTSAKGLLPENKLNRHNINLKQTAKFFEDRLTLEGAANYIQQDLQNSPLTGFYFNPIVGLYLFPRSLNLNDYNTFETFDAASNKYVQNWHSLGDSETTQQNPWWIQNRNTSTSDKSRLILNGSAKFKVNNWLSLQARGSMDRTTDVFERKMYAGTQAVIAQQNGAYNYSNITFTQKYADFFANFNSQITDKLKFTGLVGSSITDWNTEGMSFNTGASGLRIANVFAMQNTTTPITTNESNNRRQLQSVFGSANFDYDGWLFLDLSARNDWSSSLAFTETPSFFYPSVGLSANIHDKLNLPDFINFMKIRGSWAEVGNDLPAYKTNLLNSLGNFGNVNINTVTSLATLKPEITRSIEAGTEIKMFNNRIGVDFTYYKTNTRNQYFEIAASEASLFGTYAINAGNIQNEGLELLLNYEAVRGEDFNWSTALNYSMNKNTIISLDDRIQQFSITGENRSNYASRFEVGGSFGDIYGIDFLRDEQGRIRFSENGVPLKGSDYVKMGNSNPRWQMGWSNTLNYKNLGLYFLIDGKFDYDVLSITESVMDGYGVSARTGAARDAGMVTVNGVSPSGEAVTAVTPQTWYTTVGGIGPVTSNYMYNGSAIRMREIALSYNFKLDSKFVKGLRVAATGRNLFFLYKEAPFDPETSMSTGNGLSGVDIFMMPSSRSYGLSLNVNF